VGTHVDITERRTAEEKLRNSESMLREAQKVSNVGSWSYDVETKKSEWSDQMFHIFDVDPDDGVPDYESQQRLFHPEDLAEINQAVSEAVEKGIGYDLELRIVSKERSVRYVNTACEPQTNNKGDIIRLVGTVKDLTDRKRSEEEVRKLNENLEQRVMLRTAELKDANKELGAFAYSVSHDLRAPLRGIDGFSQVLLENYHDELDDRGKDYLNRVRGAAQRMGRLIDDILKLSRITRSEMIRDTVNLSAIAEKITSELRLNEPQRQVEVNIASDLSASGDSALLEAMLGNLLGNAWKFTEGREPAMIEIGREETDDGEAYFVRDNGAGFDMAFYDKLFDAFQRLHDTTEFPGTGIGLAIVQRIVSRHGGRIWGTGVVDEGATFYFTLPQ
jgi:PAS domain S-box-containing protein